VIGIEEKEVEELWNSEDYKGEGKGVESQKVVVLGREDLMKVNKSI
jgi:hypothetical protein